MGTYSSLASSGFGFFFGLAGAGFGATGLVFTGLGCFLAQDESKSMMVSSLVFRVLMFSASSWVPRSWDLVWEGLFESLGPKFPLGEFPLPLGLLPSLPPFFSKQSLQ